MRVLGLVSSPTDVKWALLDGTYVSPCLLPMPTKSQRLPINVDEGNVLHGLYRLVCTLLTEQSVGKVSILQASNSQFRSASPRRIKVEAIVQLAIASLDLRVGLVSPQTLRARERKFSTIAGGAPEDILNGSQRFTPKPWRDAVLVAWIGLDES
jgi:hypothetical protein